MDAVILSSIMTVVSFATFVGILFWACSPGVRRSFDEAARLPFMEDGGADRGDEETRR
jgi:cytochrome c oxidase cbb3-type subunit 4